MFWHMQLYMSWYIRSFFGFTFLNILYFFKYSCTNIFHRRSLYTFYHNIGSQTHSSYHVLAKHCGRVPLLCCSIQACHTTYLGHHPSYQMGAWTMNWFMASSTVPVRTWRRWSWTNYFQCVQGKWELLFITHICDTRPGWVKYTSI